jgi:hypothetical protein
MYCSLIHSSISPFNQFLSILSCFCCVIMINSELLSLVFLFYLLSSILSLVTNITINNKHTTMLHIRNKCATLTQHSRNTHATLTQHSRNTHATLTQHTRNTHATHTQHTRNTHATHTQHTRNTHANMQHTRNKCATNSQHFYIILFLHSHRGSDLLAKLLR